MKRSINNESKVCPLTMAAFSISAIMAGEARTGMSPDFKLVIRQLACNRRHPAHSLKFGYLNHTRSIPPLSPLPWLS